MLSRLQHMPYPAMSSTVRGYISTVQPLLSNLADYNVTPAIFSQWQQAFNAFLKTLEEPPPYAIFILATTEKHKILPTILSRCQIFDFKRITTHDIVAHLQSIAGREGMIAQEAALHIIAQKSEGCMRDALSMLKVTRIVVRHA